MSGTQSPTGFGAHGDAHEQEQSAASGGARVDFAMDMDDSARARSSLELEGRERHRTMQMLQRRLARRRASAKPRGSHFGASALPRWEPVPFLRPATDGSAAARLHNLPGGRSRPGLSLSSSDLEHLGGHASPGGGRSPVGRGSPGLDGDVGLPITALGRALSTSVPLLEALNLGQPAVESQRGTQQWEPRDQAAALRGRIAALEAELARVEQLASGGSSAAAPAATSLPPPTPPRTQALSMDDAHSSPDGGAQPASKVPASVHAHMLTPTRSPLPAPGRSRVGRDGSVEAAVAVSGVGAVLADPGMARAGGADEAGAGGIGGDTTGGMVLERARLAAASEVHENARDRAREEAEAEASVGTDRRPSTGSQPAAARAPAGGGSHHIGHLLQHMSPAEISSLALGPGGVPYYSLAPARLRLLEGCEWPQEAAVRIDLERRVHALRPLWMGRGEASSAAALLKLAGSPLQVDSQLASPEVSALPGEEGASLGPLLSHGQVRAAVAAAAGVAGAPTAALPVSLVPGGASQASTQDRAAQVRSADQQAQLAATGGAAVAGGGVAEEAEEEAEDDRAPLWSPEAFQRVAVTGSGDLTGEMAKACHMLHECVQLRYKWVWRRKTRDWGCWSPADFPNLWQDDTDTARPAPGAEPHRRQAEDEQGRLGRLAPEEATDKPAAPAPAPAPAAGGSDDLPRAPRIQPLTGSDRDLSKAIAPLTPTAGAKPGLDDTPLPEPPLTKQDSVQSVAPRGHEPIGLLRSDDDDETGGYAGARLGREVRSSSISRQEAEAGANDPELFYRRRPELPFKPFQSAAPKSLADAVGAEWRDGVLVPVLLSEGVEAEALASPPCDAAPAAAGGGDGDEEDDSAAAPVRSRRGEVRTLKRTQHRCFPMVDTSNGRTSADERLPIAHGTFQEFLADYEAVVRCTHTAFVKELCWRRLRLLEARFELHKLLNGQRELDEQKRVPHRDFYNVRKVDTHVHHSACPNQKHLLRFIKHKLKRHAEEEVTIDKETGEPMTLRQVFQRLNLTAYDLSIDTLDMHAGDHTFHRFDRFNLKYNPIGQSKLREVFLKVDNHIRGKYLAQVTQEVFQDLEASKYQMAEYRISIYGRKPGEWARLAEWVVGNGLASRNVRWLIQIPRIYSVFRQTGQVSNFQEMLSYIFEPLMEVTLNPAADPALHQFLGLVVGFDCVDDESKQERRLDGPPVPPHLWTSAESPPYHYWIYYLSANLSVLNGLRRARGLSEFSFRPHGGEAGSIDHMAACFLAAESVNHGITMKRAPALQYLYYLAQVGLAMSPLSNNRLFIEYAKNPFSTFFRRGLNVSISTDDPLLLHLTKEPLVEEYVVAAQVWKLAPADLCEVARNSVLQSGFEHPFKAHFIGHSYDRPGPLGNSVHYTNVPDIRLQYRYETLQGERQLIQAGAAKHNEQRA